MLESCCLWEQLFCFDVMFFWNDPTDGVPVNNFGQLSEPLTYNTPAAAMCSLVRIG